MDNNTKWSFKVTASILTYNQADSIGKAIESAVNQEVNFPYEIIIGDDCSTDGTRDILFDYQNKYPELIKLNLHDEHYGGIAGRLNNITNIQSAKGEYIAFLDGDDYWISKDKLKKQAAFLDHHPNYPFSFHDILINNRIKNKQHYLSEVSSRLKTDQSFTFEGFLNQIFFDPAATAFTSTTMYRTACLRPLPDWFWNVYLADYFSQLIAGSKGEIKYHADIKAGRLRTKSGVSFKFNNPNIFLEIQENDNYYYKKILGDKLYNQYVISAQSKKYLKKSGLNFRKFKLAATIKYLIKAVQEDKKIIRFIARRYMQRLRHFVLH